METNKATYYLYEAYLDVRVAKNPLVRNIGMAKQWDKDTFYCYFWFEEYSVRSKATTFESISKVEYFKSDMLWTIKSSQVKKKSKKQALLVSVPANGVND